MILDEGLFEAVQTGDVRGSYKKKYQPKLSYNKIYDSLEDLGYNIKASDNSNLESAIMVSKRYEKNLQKAKNYCKEVGLECKQRYSKTQDRYYLDIILPEDLKENLKAITEDFEEYKGYNIEHNFYGQDEYTVQYQGDDVWFDNKEEARKFIDGITSGKNMEESKKSEIKSSIKSAQSEIDYIKTATETAKSHLETIKANKDQYLPDPSDKRYDELLDKYEQLIKGFEETVEAGEKIISEIKRKSSIKEDLILDPTEEDKKLLNDLLDKYKDTKYEKILDQLKSKYEFEEASKNFSENKEDLTESTIGDPNKYSIIVFGEWGEEWCGEADTEEEAKKKVTELNAKNTNQYKQYTYQKGAVKEQHVSESLKEDLSQEEQQEYGLNTLINELIKSEYDAIDEYNSAIVTFEAENQGEYTDVIRSIIEDERHHIGNLQEIMNRITPGTEQEFEKGKEEAEQTLSEEPKEEVETIKDVELEDSALQG